MKKENFTNSYYSDLHFKDMFYGIIIRTSYSSGNIESINIPESFDDDDIYFFTEKDIPGTNLITSLETKMPIFCDKNILYKGQAIGILVGPSIKELREAEKKIIINYTNTKSKDDYSVFTDNDILERRVFSFGESENEFAKSEIKIDRKIKSNLVYINKAECQGAVVSFTNNDLKIYTPTQWQSNLRQNLSNALDIDDKKIIIHKTKNTDFGTNSLYLNTLLACQVSIAAYHLNKTIRLTLSRQEHELYIEHPIPVDMHFRVGLNSENKIKALNASIIVKCGFANPFIKEILDRLIISTCGLYESDCFHLEAFAIQTPNQSYSANFHWIDAHSLYGIETIMQEIASELKISPIEFRLLNLHKLSKKNSTKPFLIPTNSINEIFEKIQAKSDFNRKYTSYTLSKKNKIDSSDTLPIRGINIATAYEGSGLFGSVINPSNFFIELEMDVDNSVTIYSYTPSLSIENIWKSIVSEYLEVPKDAIKLNSCFTNSKEPPLPETLNDNISIMTQLLVKCCKAIQTQRFRQPLPIKVKRSFAQSKKDKWNIETMSGIPFYSTSCGAAVTEIEIDPCTYLEKIRNIWIIIDGGKLLDKTQALLTIKKSVQKVLSIVHKDVILDAENIYVDFIESNDSPKQIGEIVYNMLPASIAGAISNAFDKSILSIPFDTDSIYDLANISEEKDENNINNQ